MALQPTLKNRTMFCGDNLDVVRGFNSESVDLIYLDPPFNKKKMFFAPIGSSAEGAHFDDTWQQKDIKDEWLGLIANALPNLYLYLKDIDKVGDKSNKYYLIYMAVRLLEFKRILKDTGSIYLHCDATVGHYLKLLMDCIFGHQNFRNEIVWWYKGTGNQKYAFPGKHDSILFYASGKRNVYHPIMIANKKVSGWTGKNEKRVDSVWQINTVFQSKERGNALGYPTQKPLALLERIIRASSNAGQVVLDPFCGCATACVAAERLERRWIGIDLSDKVYRLVNLRIDKEVPSDLFCGKAIYRTDIPSRTDGTVVKQTRKDMMEILFGRQHGLCAGCKYSFPFSHYKLAYIVAVKKGGSDELKNRQLLCGICHRMKGNQDMAGFHAQLKKLGYLK